MCPCENLLTVTVVEPQSPAHFVINDYYRQSLQNKLQPQCKKRSCRGEHQRLPAETVQLLPNLRWETVWLENNLQHKQDVNKQNSAVNVVICGSSNTKACVWIRWCGAVNVPVALYLWQQGVMINTGCNMLAHMMNQWPLQHKTSGAEDVEVNVTIKYKKMQLCVLLLHLLSSTDV